jgi:hypothetical protein
MSKVTHINWVVKSPSNYKTHSKFRDLIKYMRDHINSGLEGSHADAWYGIDERGREVGVMTNTHRVREMSIDDAWEMIFGNEGTVSNSVELVSLQKPLI